MFKVSRGAAIGALSVGSLVMTARSEAALIVNNPKVDDFSTPIVLGETYLGMTVTNTSADPARLKFSLRASLLDQDGNPAMASNGTLRVRTILDPDTRLTLEALSGAPVAGESEYAESLPVIPQTDPIFGGTMFLGTLDITPSFVFLPGESKVISLGFTPAPDGAAAGGYMVTYLNDGMIGIDPALGALQPSVVSSSYIEDGNTFLAVTIVTVPVPEPGTTGLLVLGAAAAAGGRTRRQRKA